MSSTPHTRETLLEYYRLVRSRTEEIVEPITPEDAQVQSMSDVSPTKWHLGHTSWFFETFLLGGLRSYESMNPKFKVIFNSYYNAVGEQHPRPRRGMLCRPSLAQVLEYRHSVDAGMMQFIEALTDDELEQKAGLIELGLNHEEQHQELILTDILHVFASDPMDPAYCMGEAPRMESVQPVRWHDYEEGIYWIGHESGSFAFDNESPRHRQFVHGYRLASRPVTSGEFLAFMEDGGYERPDLWLSDGWATIQQEGWRAPFYWERVDGSWHQMTLYGKRPIDINAPVCHVSYFEADAYASWSGARLPTESEWEVAAYDLPREGRFFESGNFVPLAAEASGDGPLQMFGDVWEWTRSSYSGYPGFRPSQGALGEYNGKFMCNQLVLRGGSVATPAGHIRPTYRNFFHAGDRWQFMGFRLAKDAL